jgi:hypothetical protein
VDNGFRLERRERRETKETAEKKLTEIKQKKTNTSIH